MNLLIAFATTDGMTWRISEHLAETARAAGHQVALVDTRSVPAGFSMAGFDATLIGASVHARRYQRSVKRFVRSNLAAIGRKPSAFFSVGLAEHSRLEAVRQEGRRLAEQLPESLGWKPDLVQSIAGAYLFSRYGLVRGFIMRQIASHEEPPVDASQDQIYTDWDRVDDFLRSFLDLVTEVQVIATLTARPGEIAAAAV